MAAAEIIANLCKEEHNLADIMAKARPTSDPFCGSGFSISEGSDAAVVGLRTQVLNGLLRDRLTAQRRKAKLKAGGGRPRRAAPRQRAARSPRVTRA